MVHEVHATRERLERSLVLPGHLGTDECKRRILPVELVLHGSSGCGRFGDFDRLSRGRSWLSSTRVVVASQGYAAQRHAGDCPIGPFHVSVLPWVGEHSPDGVSETRQWGSSASAVIR